LKIQSAQQLSEAPSQAGQKKQRLKELQASWRAGQRHAKAAEQAIIPQRTEGAPVPISLEQRRLWFFQQLHPQAPAYNLEFTFLLEGVIDHSALELAFQELLRRHELLRSVVALEQGQPVLVAAPEKEFQLRCVRMEGSLGPELMEALSRRIYQPYDLSRGPLFTAELWEIDSGHHILLVLAHHLVWDGCSTSVFFNELESLYRSFMTGTANLLPPLPAQYADFAVWQSSRRTEQGDLKWWQDFLADVPALSTIPADRARPAELAHQGESIYQVLPENKARVFAGFCQSEGVTEFMVWMALMGLLVYRYTGQQDVVIGTAAANRMCSELEPLIGFFVNMLPFRARLERGMNFRELLAQVRTTSFAVFQRNEIPFEKIVERVHPQRSLSHNPLFQSMLVVQNVPFSNLRLTGARCEQLYVEKKAIDVDIALYVEPAADSRRLLLVYNRELFDRTTMQRVLRDYVSLLDQCMTGPGRSLDSISIQTSTAKHQLLREWNDAADVTGSGRLLQQMVEAQAAQSPDAAAVSCERESFTYRELNQSANRIADLLREQGAGPEIRIAICLPRSSGMLAALLGVLKSGAAYLPLDPGLPQERLRFMLEDSRPAILVTLEHLRDRLPLMNGMKIICLDTYAEDIRNRNAADPSCRVSVDNAVYVIYTSGSTGVPKGVVVTHGALANFLDSMAESPGVNSSDTVLAITSLSFDIAALELYLPLTVGARLHVSTQDEAKDPVRLRKNLLEQQVTVMQATPSTWRMLLQPGFRFRRGFKALCGGEAMDGQLAGGLIATGATVWNLYGPTETTVWSSRKRLQSAARVSIGRPIAGTQAYVLDANLRPSGIGVPGELYIGGAGVARGYLNRPELTADRFVPDPHTGPAGVRMYKTGDVVRYLDTGEIQFLRRADDQIKMRGFRIELGEIEAALTRLPSIREAAVHVDHGNGTLTAYVAANTAMDEYELRNRLREWLPEYMVPQSFVILESLRHTISGKIDRRRLRAVAALPAHAVAPPRTAVEAALLEIWQELLRRTHVSILDSFFDLGGHSLLATQMMNRLQQSFKMEVPLRTLFEAPTIAGLAARIDALSRQKQLAQERRRELLSRISQLSSTEVQQMLQ
jgi:amino acid adenylation domain-containing protein